VKRINGGCQVDVDRATERSAADHIRARNLSMDSPGMPSHQGLKKSANCPQTVRIHADAVRVNEA
jgi:hypothetical protein